jgi:hypothetical protein
MVGVTVAQMAGGDPARHVEIATLRGSPPSPGSSGRPSPSRWPSVSPRVICDLSTSPYVDLAGARMLRTLADELAGRGIAFRVTDARGATRDLLRDEGLEAATGRIDRVTSVADVVDELAGA